ncbi:MAG TPA: hypothetical protein DCQ52_11120 [Acidimicrobiaceae bacterium]|nr:hypothetical protein [Acidimicrobiaceae bacterium]
MPPPARHLRRDPAQFARQAHRGGNGEAATAHLTAAAASRAVGGAPGARLTSDVVDGEGNGIAQVAVFTALQRLAQRGGGQPAHPQQRCTLLDTEQRCIVGRRRPGIDGVPRSRKVDVVIEQRRRDGHALQVEGGHDLPDAVRVGGSLDHHGSPIEHSHTREIPHRLVGPQRERRRVVGRGRAP